MQKHATSNQIFYCHQKDQKENNSKSCVYILVRRRWSDRYSILRSLAHSGKENLDCTRYINICWRWLVLNRACKKWHIHTSFHLLEDKIELKTCAMRWNNVGNLKIVESNRAYSSILSYSWWFQSSLKDEEDGSFWQFLVVLFTTDPRGQHFRMQWIPSADS